MSSNGKDVIYVDVDDEITGIIDKVTSANAKIVALVLPKRASVFQSIVNMKLLKRRAEGAKKHLVLITSETSLMPLAGSVGLYVAKTLQSKPEIPEALAAGAAIEDSDEAVAVDGEFDPEQARDKPIGDLAGRQAGAGVVSQMPEETIEIDNTDAEPLPPTTDSGGKDVAALAAGGAAGKAGKNGKNKNKKLKVPNFEKFRLKLALGVLGLILLAALWFVAFNVLPAAAVTITTNASDINSTPTLTLDTNATKLDETASILPAQTQQSQKSYTQTVAATGKQNNGTKATGTVTMTAQSCIQSGNLNPPQVAAGTGLSANGLTFITQSDAQFNISGNTPQCVSYTSSPVAITAQKGGSQYNVSDGTSFTVAGNSSVNATGSTTGGTDNIVTIVQQSDIDGAKAKLTAGQDTGSIKQQLQQQLQASGLDAIAETFSAGKLSMTISTKVGDTADNITVTENVTYTMFGVQKSDLQKILDDNVNTQIDTSKQSILNDGLSSASFSVPNPGSTTKIQVAMQATSSIGPKLNQAQLKAQIAGKKSGDAQNVIAAIPGVEKVSVHLSPFWVSHVPDKTAKITFKFVKSSSNNGNGH